MTRASTLLASDQRAAVERAIAEAEKQTAAEIVMVLATRSGRYDRAEDTVGLLLAVIAVAAAWVLWQSPVIRWDDWGTGQVLAFGLVTVLAMFVFWALAGAALATRIPALARPFISRGHREAEVRRRGVEAFHLFRVARTADRNGVLIYVSLFERMAWVGGDEAVSTALPPGTWDEACRAITAAFRAGEPDKGLIQAVSLTGTALATRFPPGVGAVNELANTIHFMD